MLTRRGIEANPDQWQMIINMRILTSIKEVQHLTDMVAPLSSFLSCLGDKYIDFFATLSKLQSFLWIEECENVFQEQQKIL